MGTKTSSAGPHGVVVIDKPAGWTSHDVVAKSRGVIGTRKVGHSGTLDPDATGVLVLGVGHATRLLRFLTELPKRYEGEIVLGTETTTLDAAGEITATHDMSAVTDDQVRAAANRLTGDLMQVPPMVSAIKIDGKRLHELAREGKEVDRPPRPVRVDRFDVEPVEGARGVWRCVVDCSSGTYIRSLAADLGTALGGGAHLRSLRRTSVGGFTLDDAGTIESPTLLPVSAAVQHLELALVDEDTAVLVGHGRVLPLEQLQVSGGGPWAVLGEDGALLAVYESHRQGGKPTVVIPR
ncbi:MAG TPA: tRNA pseudouridine(55) synthase TruB [Acidimicrobiaceae bacterium]|nr:tRNA pseudouridine(55) synthase TruB [Acidimicrobiaceae bacterium]HBH75145.1 tRNA pseudouridine(55) synthase TruB [Acidimicrobiaceae bacterium]